MEVLEGFTGGEVDCAGFLGRSTWGAGVVLVESGEIMFLFGSLYLEVEIGVSWVEL